MLFRSVATAVDAPVTVSPFLNKGDSGITLINSNSTPAVVRPQYPVGTTVDFPVVVTIATATPYVVSLSGVAVSPSLAVNPVGNATINIEIQYAPSGIWFPVTDSPIAADSTADDKQHPSVPRCHAIRFTRAAGTNATSTVVLA